MFCDGLCLDIHRFSKEREWAQTDKEGGASGVTWIELFAPFDTTGARTQRGQHIKDIDAKKRGDARRKKTEANLSRGIKGSASVKPSLDEELKRFKAIIRHIGRHETAEGHHG